MDQQPALSSPIEAPLSPVVADSSIIDITSMLSSSNLNDTIGDDSLMNHPQSSGSADDGYNPTTRGTESESLHHHASLTQSSSIPSRTTIVPGVTLEQQQQQDHSTNSPDTQQISHQENIDNSPDSNPNEQSVNNQYTHTPSISSTIISTIQSILYQISYSFYTFLYSSFSCTIPTKQLYIISITLLIVHWFTEVLIDHLPYFWLMIFNNLIGFDHLPPKLQYLVMLYQNLTIGDINTATVTADDGIMLLLQQQQHQHQQQQIQPHRQYSNMTEMELLKQILGAIIDEAFPNPNQYLQHHDNEGINSISNNNDSWIRTSDMFVHDYVKKPILSIMIPTTILSIFLVITTTIFLMIHISFQSFVYISSRISSDNINNNGRNGQHNHNNERIGDMHSSPLVVWGIIAILMLETILPWICLSFGVYLSFSVGGFAWSIFVSTLYLTSVGLRYLRNRVYIGFQ